LAGEVRDRTGEVRLAELGGLAEKLPFLAVAFVIASMASVGMPGLANFSGEILVFFGAFQPHKIVTVLALWGVVVSAIYQLGAVKAVFFGPFKEKFAHAQDLTTFAQRWPYLMLIAGLLILGFAPGVLLNLIQPSVKLLLGAP
jgi:NADH-quinone oxidoreductase subunit M